MRLIATPSYSSGTPSKLKDINISNKHNRLKNPNWPKTYQLAMNKHDQRVELGFTKKQLQLSGQGPVSQKPQNLFAPVKPLRSSVSKTGEVFAPETSCMKRTFVHIKNVWIKQLCKCKVWDFAMALRARKVSGTFLKRAKERDLNLRSPCPSRWLQWGAACITLVGNEFVEN